MLVEIKYFDRTQKISAAFVEIIDEPLQACVIDVIGNKTVVDCNDKAFIRMNIDGETACRNPNVKRR